LPTGERHGALGAKGRLAALAVATREGRPRRAGMTGRRAELLLFRTAPVLLSSAMHVACESSGGSAPCRVARDGAARRRSAGDAIEGSAMDSGKGAYRAVTRQIEVTVTPRFLPDRSSPENGYFFWAYTIVLANHGGETVQLKTRHWRITDANGRLQEVRGAGVVGEEPVLRPGENFQYTSGVPLPTPSGFMTGSYGMVTAAGERFDIAIPSFSLDTPQSGRTVN
jgi:ApaG protein